MCRFFIYKGQVMKLNYLFEHNNSILKQSMHIPFTPLIDERNYRDHDINGDGFGICWEKDNQLYSYKSSKPPWNDVNISNLSDYIESNLFLCHIRAIKAFSQGSCVHEHNCHPFIYKNLTWMHNGNVSKKALLCKYLYENIDINILNNLKGNTDSEYCFFIFISLLIKKNINLLDINENDLVQNMIDCINLIKNMSNDIVSLNFCVYDGKTLICSRYINTNEEYPPSLYYSTDFEINNDFKSNRMISSEPITTNNGTKWDLVPKNNLLILNNIDEFYLKEINSQSD